jgi:leucyl/phenylalanyl-tRNA--protein transferase
LRGFTADDLIDCYRRGVFPMADSRRDRAMFLVNPARRGVLPLDGLHISHRLARTVRSERFDIKVDSAFDAVIEACAASRPGRLETWINDPIQSLCGQLFARGKAHSVEAWRERSLVGGLYGIAIGGAFFGESMFSRERDASKVALAHLVARMRIGAFRLLDTQFITHHLASLGAVEITRVAYARRLAAALDVEGDFFAAGTQLTGAAALQATSQAS